LDPLKAVNIVHKELKSSFKKYQSIDTYDKFGDDMKKLYHETEILFDAIERTCKRLSAAMNEYESEAKDQTTIDSYFKKVNH
jgi:putative heme degradation protein